MLIEVAYNNLACLPLVKTMETFTSAEILLEETFTSAEILLEKPPCRDIIGGNFFRQGGSLGSIITPWKQYKPRDMIGATFLV